MNGASTANGAIVMSRVSAIRPRACSTEVLKNKVPASATATPIANSARTGGSNAAASSPSTVPTKVIAPRTPAAAPQAWRGTTSGSST